MHCASFVIAETKIKTITPCTVNAIKESQYSRLLEVFLMLHLCSVTRKLNPLKPDTLNNYTLFIRNHASKGNGNGETFTKFAGDYSCYWIHYICFYCDCLKRITLCNCLCYSSRFTVPVVSKNW